MQPLTPRKKNAVLDDAGFTLLEIIAVLVILSILAVVAVPRYFDLQEQAKTRAMETAMAEAISRVNGYFAQELLRGELHRNINYTTETVGGTPDADGNNMGDFRLTVSGGEANTTGPITLTVEPAPNVSALSGAATLTREIPRPGLPDASDDGSGG